MLNRKLDLASPEVVADLQALQRAADQLRQAATALQHNMLVPDYLTLAVGASATAVSKLCAERTQEASDATQ